MRRLDKVLTGIAIVGALSTGTAQAAARHSSVSGVELAAKAAGDAANSSLDTADSSVSILETDTDSLPHSPDTDDRLRRADAHLNAGRQMYFEGDLAGARREFDAAVDTLLNAPENAVDHRRIERRLDEICDLIYRFDIEKLGSTLR